MSATTAVNIDFITQYKGSQNLKHAQSDMEKLGAAVKKLGALFGVAFAGRELLAFTKHSVQAFATNEKQIAILSNTLKNFGVQNATDGVNKFITAVSEASGKSKEELIPAFQKLFIATGDVIGSQNELKLAMDISAGTGKDLEAVTAALAKGYLGNTTALTRLGAGLSKTVLATKDMNLINKQLAKTFTGDTAVAAETLQGRVDRLKISFHEMQVEIGAGLVDAFTILGKNNGIEQMQSKLHTIGVEIADITVGVATLIEYLNKIPGAGFFDALLKANYRAGILGQIADLGKVTREAMTPKVATGLMGDKNKENIINATALKLAQSEAAANAKALVAAKAIAKAAQDKLKAERDSLNLKLAGSTVDMQNIEIQAALQRGQTQQVNDVLLLQRAIITGNADQAEVLSQAILKANGLVMDVKGNISSLGSAKDPFADWPTLAQSALDQIKLMLAEFTKNAVVVKVKVVGGDGGSAGDTGNQTVDNIKKVLGFDPTYGGASAGSSGVSPASMMASPAPSTDYAAQLGQYFAGVAQQPPVQINVSAVPGIIVDATQGSSSNGTPVTLDRLSPLGYLGIK